jgi:hypothetical protein
MTNLATSVPARLAATGLALLGVVAGVATAAPAEAATSTVAVSTSSQLQTALKNAKPGQTITLADGTYTGKFVAAADGSAKAPITLAGSSKAVLTTGSTSSGYGLNVTGTSWVVSGISVTKAQKGIMLDDADGTVLDGVNVGNTGHEGIHVRKGSTDVVVRNSTVHDTGKQKADFGEGIYVGSAKSNWKSIMGSSSTIDASDRVLVENNVITNTAAEGIDIKEGTSAGTIRGNVFTNSGYSGANYGDSFIDVKGNGYTITGNSGTKTKTDAFQVHQAVSGWGTGNTFSGNGAFVNVPGFEVNVEQKVAGKNSVECGATGAAKGVSNIRCS